MNRLRSVLNWSVLLVAVLLVNLAAASAQTPTAQTPTPGRQTPSGVKPSAAVATRSYPPALVESGRALFRRDCSFCHGRDAGGGESGLDLTRSKLVTADVGGDKIGAVIRDGRPGTKMPSFNYSDQQIAGLMAFIHTQQNNALRNKGGRKGVDVSDLQTGNAQAGKQYFDGAGGCSACHSPTGDLAGVASRYEGLKLEEQMLYPDHAKSRVTVTPASGQTITGTLDYLDEFTVGLIDSTGVYRSWRTSDVQYKVDAPVNAHMEQFSKYTDADIHNLMAYLQTLR
ncbi:MAG TPA: c-type cytochrome [Candidatus Acidoferrales bacterium]|nr:c-type cytochrome [Candidatus Acidoferrales bacterium]